MKRIMGKSPSVYGPLFCPSPLGRYCVTTRCTPIFAHSWKYDCVISNSLIGLVRFNYQTNIPEVCHDGGACCGSWMNKGSCIACVCLKGVRIPFLENGMGNEEANDTESSFDVGDSFLALYHTAC